MGGTHHCFAREEREWPKEGQLAVRWGHIQWGAVDWLPSQSFGMLVSHGWEASVSEPGIPRLWLECCFLAIRWFLSLPLNGGPSSPSTSHEHPQNPCSRCLAATQVGTHLDQVSPSEGAASAEAGGMADA